MINDLSSAPSASSAVHISRIERLSSLEAQNVLRPLILYSKLIRSAHFLRFPVQRLVRSLPIRVSARNYLLLNLKLTTNCTLLKLEFTIVF